jgi:hypothetical protein
MAPAGFLHPQVDADLDDVEDDIRSGRYRPNADGRQLQVHKTIATVWPEQPPDNHFSVYVGLRGKWKGVNSRYHSANVGPLAQSVAQTVVFPTTANITEFTMKLGDLECWDRLCEDDLYYSNVRQAGSSQFLQEFRERLGRKRYIGNDAKDVRAALRCCRSPDFRCSRYMSHSGTLSSPVRQSLLRLWTHILGSSHP